MLYEGLSSPAQEPQSIADLDPQTRAELEGVFAKTSLEQFQNETGFGVAELAQYVTYETTEGVQTATVATMLSHDSCPMGKWTRNAYKKGGLAEVQDMYQDLSKREPGLNIVVSEQVLARENPKKK
ncbi:MAG TPA: hypothetical protein VN778_00375 [Verrucomicrobiae bacterium]|nr:hypothetical protein [Verrucomicrobiae bacterium]